MEEEMTTMQISKKNLDKLEKIKEHPRVPNDEIVGRLIDFWERYKGIVDQRK